MLYVFQLINCRSLPIYFNHVVLQNGTSCLSHGYRYIQQYHFFIAVTHLSYLYLELGVKRKNNKYSLMKVNQIVMWMLLTTQNLIELHWFASSLPRNSEIYINWFFLPLWIRRKCPNVTCLCLFWRIKLFSVSGHKHLLIKQ